MNTKEDLIKTLFDEDVMNKAIELMYTDRTKDGFINSFSIEKNEISFRLYKPYSGIVNLEFLIRTNNYTSYQPIGFYKSNEIYVLNEFVDTYTYLFENKIINKKARANAFKNFVNIDKTSILAE